MGYYSTHGGGGGGGGGSVNSVTAGAGLVDVGVATDPVLNVVAADATITVNADSIQVGTIQTANIADEAVTLGKIQQTNARFLGRTSLGTGIVEELTAAQATANLNVFTTTLNGLVPTPGGGGASRSLRADGSWTTPGNVIASLPAQVGDDAIFLSVAGDTIGPRKNNLIAQVSPTVNDDSTAGYAVGSMWFNVYGTRPDKYVCTDATPGAAVWIHTTNQPEQSGFIDAEDCTLSWSNVTRTLTCTGDYDFYSRGKKFRKQFGDSFQITDVDGEHFIYYDETGTLVESTSFDIAIITEYAFVAFVYWNATDGEAVPSPVYELHGANMSPDTHVYLHETVGSAYVNGMDITADSSGNGNSASHCQLAYTAGEFRDEDIIHTVVAKTLLTDNFPIIYREGILGRWKNATLDSFLITKTGVGGEDRAAWNEFTGATWQLTEVTNQDYLLTHIYAIPGIDNQAGYLFGVVGQAEYANAQDAEAGAEAEAIGLQLDGLPSQEFILVASVILQTSNTYLNTPQSRIVPTNGGDDYVDWLAGGSGGIAGGGTGDVIGPSGAEDNTITAFDGSTGKIIKLTNVKIGDSTAGVGNRTLGVDSTLCGGTISNGTAHQIEATGVGSIALGFTTGINGTATVRASGQGSVILGGAGTSGNSDIANLFNSGVGGLVFGYPAGSGLSRTTTINNTTTGSIVGGNAIAGGTVESVSGADGSAVIGYCRGATSIVRSTTGLSNFVHGVAGTTGTSVNCNLLAQGTAGFIHGYASSTSGTSTISAGAGSLGAFAVGAVLNGTISVSGGTVGAFAGGAGIAGATVNAGASGAFVWAYGVGPVTASATATGAVQFGIGTNAIAGALQVGDTTNGLRLIPGGTTSTIDGSFWVDGNSDVNMRSAGVTQTFSNPTVTGSRGGNAALTSLLSQLATMGLIVDSTT